MALEHEIVQFGQRMGLANLALSADNRMLLEIEGMGQMYFERTPNEFMIYLARPISPYDKDMPRRLLAICHYGKAHSMPLNGGVQRGQAILLTRMAQHTVTTATLENSVQYLSQQMDSVFQN